MAQAYGVNPYEIADNRSIGQLLGGVLNNVASSVLPGIFGKPATQAQLNTPGNSNKPEEQNKVPAWLPWAVGGAAVLLLGGVAIVAFRPRKG